jgi:UDP-N-acetylglucosamine--N-acetylmuramyl-(pentapeptide) pyrophosphoryl-undecaprenol N-acetylglucosamine transferase
MGLSLLIAGGGTGGHLYPGIAVAREIKSRIPDADVTFVGTAAGLEARVVPREGYALDVIRSAGLKGKSLLAVARGIALLPLSAADAWRVITHRRPSVVVGVGGYSSGPLVLLAALRGIPTLLMEQNATPGFTNRLLAPVVDVAAVTFQESVKVFGRKAVVSGNPVRPEFLEDQEAQEHDAGIASRITDHGESVVSPPRAARVLIFGGSQGAHAINVAMVAAATRLAAAAPGVALTHQTGERDLEMVRDGYRRAGLQARVEPFLFSMEREMKSADLVICRAGATTLAELTAAGKASILVPLPTATDDHQRNNARVLAMQGAARIIEQQELIGDRIADEIIALAEDPAARRIMERAARQMARPDAAKVIVDRIIAMAERKR